jgi:ATP-dependent RNA helicase DDX51/DBP6
MAERNYVVEQYASTLSAAERNAIIQRFNRGEIDMLICTDALSRGVDLKDHSGQEVNVGAHAVINYDPPLYVKTYVHRAGRSARAGNAGFAYTILASHECRHWKEMMRKYDLLKDVKKQRVVSDETLSCADLEASFHSCISKLQQNLGKSTNNNE